METRERFGKALRLARLRKNLPQEAFAVVSSRTFVSMLERGKTSPTIEKLEELCSVLDVHPATLVALTYLPDGQDKERSAKELLQLITRELHQLIGGSDPG
ncbi:helix-turn-helix domain-containing protein [Pseudomonas aeruginosa]|uniref:helix-turn-helix domain-containing protein n=1 Tax=Pseudomonas aeruginosa TaxID=287 RepID=UPI0015E2BCE3|nr:helix-turn-helix transcriptional regulator [Pseudomonas aeruginosa]MBA1286762.1 helix-turn-helix transcriptional regulator [Pseudomonas aeruginosa]